MAKPKLYEVVLTDAERTQLAAFTRKGMAAARELRRARILLLAAEGRPDAAVADAESGVVRLPWRGCAAAAPRTAWRRRWSIAPAPAPRRWLDGEEEASWSRWPVASRPRGECWTMRLLADRLVELDVASVSDETVRRTLEKTL